MGYTAPAIKAAGAPRFAVHSHASKAVLVESYSSPASSIPLAPAFNCVVVDVLGKWTTDEVLTPPTLRLPANEILVGLANASTEAMIAPRQNKNV